MSRGGRFRIEASSRLYRDVARSREMKRELRRIAQWGAAAAEAFAPSYSGPTWDPSVQRAGEYRASISATTELTPSGWRGEFGADAPWALQVEFGSGAGRGARDPRGRFRRVNPRPQHGWSPKRRPLGRALDSLRI